MGECPLGYYASSVESLIDGLASHINVCIPCASTCSNCTKSACTSCDSAYFLYMGFCVSVCRLGTYEYYNGLEKECRPCSPPCYQSIIVFVGAQPAD